MPCLQLKTRRFNYLAPEICDYIYPLERIGSKQGEDITKSYYDFIIDNDEQLAVCRYEI